jgi:hypothetical protein
MLLLLTMETTVTIVGSAQARRSPVTTAEAVGEC